MSREGDDLRLAVVNHHHEGGATAVAREVLAWGPERGFEVRYFAEPDPVDASRLLAELQSFAPDLVHVHCWYQSHPYDLLRRIGDTWPAVFTAHDVEVVNQYGTECWECYRNAWCVGCPALGPLRRWRPNYRMRDRWRKRRVNRATRCHVIYPSAWMRKRLGRSEWRRLPGSVIPNGVDTETFAPGPGDRAAWQLPPESPVILFAGHMYSPDDHRKGLPDLLEAFGSIRALFPEACLAVAGEVVGVAPRPGLRLLGSVPRERIADLYRSADIYCVPSRGDNLPTTVLEAMASGLPVVGTRIGGIPEEVQEPECGLLVPAEAPGDLAEALASLLAEPSRRARMGAAARDRAAHFYSRGRSADAHEHLYRQLAARPPA